MGDCSASGWIVFLFLLLLDKKTIADSNTTETIQYRLPNNVVPTSYNITLVPHMIEGNYTFDGETKIDIRVLNETYNITLHAHDTLKLYNATGNVTSLDLQQFNPINITRENATDFLILQFKDPLKPGNYSVHLKYHGKINDDLLGIYRKSYVNEKNKKSFLIATRFSPTKARRAFPCWDEPALKATFNLTINHFENCTAASNMPVKYRLNLNNDGKVWTTFETTPVMSTYLIAFVISDFSCLSNANKSFNVCATKKALPDAQFIHDVGQKVLPYIVEYTGIPYTLPKLDNFLIPEGPYGAMENWGIINYRENNVAVNNNTPCSTKQTAAELTIHELAHQWFGNLVTPAWWKYIWLKEGMSHYFQFYFADKIFPEWDMMNTFVARTLQSSAFSMDVTNHYNYLNWEPKSPEDIKSRFSTMVYHKGAVIMHMMSHILSEEVFQRGIQKYLKDHQFGVATSDDFWKAMQTVYDEAKFLTSCNIKEVMDPWVEQKGYPIVHVIRDYDNSRAILNQTSNLSSEPSNKWWIPINYRMSITNPCTSIMHWLKPSDNYITIEDIDKDDWLIINIKQSGYYRVDYDEKNWLKIAQFLNSPNYTEIHVLNRGQVINDLFFMALNDRQNFTTFFELTKYLSREVEYIPWRHASNAFKSMKRKIVDEQLQVNLKKFFLRLMKNVIDDVGFDERLNDTLVIKKKRAEILQFACDLGHIECRMIASNKLLKYLENPKENPVSPNLENWILYSGANGSKIESLLQKKIDSGETKYIKYIRCSSNKTYLRSYIDRALTNYNFSNSNDLSMMINYMACGGSENWDYALDYFIKNFDRISAYFNNSIAVSSILNDYVWKTPTISRMKKISEFTDKNYDRLPPWINTAISQQTKKLEWSKVNAPILNSWLEKELAKVPEDAQSVLQK